MCCTQCDMGAGWKQSPYLSESVAWLSWAWGAHALAMPDLHALHRMQSFLRLQSRGAHKRCRMGLCNAASPVSAIFFSYGLHPLPPVLRVHLLRDLCKDVEFAQVLLAWSSVTVLPN